MPATALNDTELVAASLSGNRDAFGQIVARYQSLVCSLAYSATGSLTHSEDLAQETFVIAWKQLKQLREPGKLSSWLCGIARNLINNWLRRQGREPSHAGETLDAVSDSHAAEPSPHEHTISREEEVILWRSLERIPETYREPLVLFYREHQSVESVAAALELSEDAVKQRLSRGRKLLAEEVTAFVEGALRLSGPGRAFTIGVLAALPVFAASASAATVGATMVHSSAAAKSAAVAGLASAIIGPIVGILGGWLGMKAGLENATSERERRLIIRMGWLMGAMVVSSTALMFAFIFFSKSLFQSHPVLTVSALVGFWAAYVGGILVLVWRFNAAQRRIRLETARNQPDAAVRETEAGEFYEYRSRWTLLGLPLVHIRSGRQPHGKRRPALGWIAIGDVAVGILFAAGGVAVGGIGMGGVGIGLIGIGGAALGVVSGAGLAIGGWAVGGVAMGWFAFGGCALGWQAAIGGMAVAKHFALGGLGFAEVFNNQAAAEYIHSLKFYSVANNALRSGWFQALVWMPMGVVIWQALRLRKQRRQRQPAKEGAGQ